MPAWIVLVTISAQQAQLLHHIGRPFMTHKFSISPWSTPLDPWKFLVWANGDCMSIFLFYGSKSANLGLRKNHVSKLVNQRRWTVHQKNIGPTWDFEYFQGSNGVNLSHGYFHESRGDGQPLGYKSGLVEATKHWVCLQYIHQKFSGEKWISN